MESNAENNLDKNNHAHESAGRIMATNFPTISVHKKINDVWELLFNESNNFETINYIYVIDHNKKLLGVFSIKDIFSNNKETLVEKIMIREVFKVRVHTDQEHVAKLALQHNLKAIPVVDKNDILLGIIPSDTILRVLNFEHSEDLLYGEGINKINLASSIIHGRLKPLVFARLPWLLFGLLGGLVAAQIVGGFEKLLATQISLVLFIPVIVYMSDAVGSQSQIIFIRSLALDHNFSTRKYFFREVRVGSIIALIIASLLSIIVWFWKGDLSLTITLGLSIAISIVISVMVAVLIPLILIKLKRDTAAGSAPFATILRDLLSIIIYFVVAQIIISLF
jgi:magnesium transporter